MNYKKQKGELIVGFILFMLMAIVVALFLFGRPIFGPWMAERQGLAEFNRAEQNRKIRVQEAISKNEAAEYLAKSEITKAKGVAEANNIMSESLGGPEGYLRWKYIEMLEETGQSSNTIVYIPTEGGMPILEAGRVKDAAPTVFESGQR